MKQFLLKHPAFLFLYLAIFISVMAFTMVFPLLPFIGKEMGVSNAMLGVLASLFALAQFLFAPFWGVLSDRIGRKPLILGGLLGMAASFLAFGLAANLAVLFLSRFFQGLFAGAAFPAIHAYVADTTTHQERVKAMGYLNAFIAMGIVLGPVIGGMLAVSNIAFPFFAAALAGTLNFLLVLRFLPESLKEKISGPSLFAKAIPQFVQPWQAFKTPLAPLFVLAFAWSFTLSNNQVAVPLLGINQFNLQTQDIGLLFTVMGLLWGIVQFFFLERITNAFGEHKTVLGGLLLMALGFGIVPFLPLHVISLYGAIMVAGIGSAVSRPVIVALLSQETKLKQGITMGTASSFESLGRFIAPLSGGALFTVAFPLPFLASALLMLLVLFFVVSGTPFLHKGHEW